MNCRVEMCTCALTRSWWSEEYMKDASEMAEIVGLRGGNDENENETVAKRNHLVATLKPSLEEGSCILRFKGRCLVLSKSSSSGARFYLRYVGSRWHLRHSIQIAMYGYYTSSVAYCLKMNLCTRLGCFLYDDFRFLHIQRGRGRRT